LFHFRSQRWLRASVVTLLFVMAMAWTSSAFAKPRIPVAPTLPVEEQLSTSDVVDFVSSVYAEEHEDLAGGGRGLAIPIGEVAIGRGISDRPFADTVIAMVNYFIGFLGFLATIAFIYAGVLWVLSGGSEEMITKARKIMIYAGLGLIVVMLSFSIVNFIQNLIYGWYGRFTGNPWTFPAKFTDLITNQTASTVQICQARFPRTPFPFAFPFCFPFTLTSQYKSSTSIVFITR